jgi:hypothetical protein
MKKLSTIPQWLFRLLWWRSSPVPRAPSADQCKEIVAATLAGHNITGLTVNCIERHKNEPFTCLVEVSFTALPPKSHPRHYDHEALLLSWDPVKRAWVSAGYYFNRALCRVEEYEHYAAAISFAKTHNANKEMLPCQNS